MGAVRLRFAGRSAGRGIVGWSIAGLAGVEPDGLPPSGAADPPSRGTAHPNGVVSIDHVVVLSPDLERTVGALRGAGLELRRVREGPTPGGSERQAFFRLGEVLLETVEAPRGSRMSERPDAPARLWGISFLVEDIDHTVEALGELVSPARDAVQPGRRIAALRREAGVGTAVAFITPGQGAA